MLPLAPLMLKGMLILSVGSEKGSYLIQSNSFRVIARLTGAQRSILSLCSLTAPTAVFCSRVLHLCCHTCASFAIFIWEYTYSVQLKNALCEAVVDYGITVVLGRWMFVFVRGECLNHPSTVNYAYLVIHVFLVVFLSQRQ